jgi:hypothetical protein
MPTRIYADTSALAKLFISEPETPELRRWLVTMDEPSLVSSALLDLGSAVSVMLSYDKLLTRAARAVGQASLRTVRPRTEVHTPSLMAAAACRSAEGFSYRVVRCLMGLPSGPAMADI